MIDENEVEESRITQPMNPEVKMRWVEALRSGVFAQGKSRLRTDPSAYPEASSEVLHCCLGVLCALAEADGVVEPHEWRNDSLLPTVVMTWAGLPKNDPWVAPRTRGSQANDTGEGFEEIATAISTYL